MFAGEKSGGMEVVIERESRGRKLSSIVPRCTAVAGVHQKCYSTTVQTGVEQLTKSSAVQCSDVAVQCSDVAVQCSKVQCCGTPERGVTYSVGDCVLLFVQCS